MQLILMKAVGRLTMASVAEFQRPLCIVVTKCMSLPYRQGYAD
jgi:hypothetical protein